MLAREIMTHDPAACTPETTIADASRMMVQLHCGALPVVESLTNRKLIGIITDRDIVCRAIAKGKSTDAHVREFMTSNPVTVLPNAAVETCCGYMESRQIRRLLVTDMEGKLLGIIAQADIAEKTPEHLTASLLEHVSRPTEEASRPVAIAA